MMLIRASRVSIIASLGAVLRMGSPALAFGVRCAAGVGTRVQVCESGAIGGRHRSCQPSWPHDRQRLTRTLLRRRYRRKMAVPEKTNEDDEQDATIRTGNLLRTLTGPELSIAVGASILLAVLTNRLVMPELVDSQARTDILGIIASGGLITNGVYMLDLNIKTAEEVTLMGRFKQEYSPTLPPGAKRDLQWLAESLLLASPATTVVVYRGGETLAKVGVMGESPVVQEGTILQKSLREGKYGRELYLPALQVLPGKIEFDYLPDNCQGVVMLPILQASAVVIIGTNRARAFTPKDIAWMKGLCDQAALSLRQAGPVVA